MASEFVVNGRFQGRRLTGVERYASEILHCLGTAVEVVKPSQPLAGVQGHLWEQFLLPTRLGRNAFLWSPANTGPLAVTRQAITIHDLSVLDHPEWFNANFRLWYMLLLPRLAKRARVVLTVSEHSRRSILRRFGLPEEKVVVVPDGVNLNQFQPCDASAVRAKYGLGERYVLFVGSLDPRKNLERLSQAMVLLSDVRNIELAIAGSWTNIFRPVAVHASKRRIRLLGYVPDEDLPALYSGATFFIMPSLFEGFGLSVLEAMACGTPVIASHAGALPEVVGDAAMLVDPTSVEGIAEGMRQLLSQPERRAELKRKGLERVHQFSWERSAQQVLEVLSANG